MTLESLISKGDSPEIVERIKKVYSKFKTKDGLYNCLTRFG